MESINYKRTCRKQNKVSVNDNTSMEFNEI